MRFNFSILLFLLFSAYLTNACSRYYTVVSGDSCYYIALSRGYTLNQFRSLNPEINCDRLQIGQKVCVTAGNDSPPTASCSRSYKVVSGDSCWRIATNNGMSVDQLIALNPGVNCNVLQIGVILCISKGSDPSPNPNPDPSPTPDGTITYQQFVDAVRACGYSTPSNSLYTSFVSRAARDGLITTKRELAMFLAEIVHESGGLYYKREIICQKDGCPNSYRSAGDPPGIYYYGRGFIQLTWSYNYRAASYALFGDDRLVKNPDLVAQSDDYSWAVSFWFWKVNVHSKVQTGKFGYATRGINGGECSPCKLACPTRFKYYSKILPIFGVNETPNPEGC